MVIEVGMFAWFLSRFSSPCSGLEAYYFQFQGVVQGVAKFVGVLTDAGCAVTRGFVNKLVESYHSQTHLTLDSRAATVSLDRFCCFMESLVLCRLLRDPSHAHHGMLFADKTKAVVEQLEHRAKDLRGMNSLVLAMLKLAEKFASTEEGDCSMVYQLHADMAKSFQAGYTCIQVQGLTCPSLVVPFHNSGFYDSTSNQCDDSLIGVRLP